MNYRILGSTDLRFSVVGFGCSHLGTLLNDPKRSEALIQNSVEIGINFFDTADSYGSGSSEIVLGRSLRRIRSKVVIATKIGYPVGMTGKLLMKCGKPWNYEYQNFKSNYLRQGVERSLRRLGIERIDLLQLHNPPTSIAQKEEIFDTLEELQRSGKIGYYGISVKNLGDAYDFSKIHGISSLQLPINIFNVKEAFVFLKKRASASLGIISRQPFSSGKIFDIDNLFNAEHLSYIDKELVQLLREKRINIAEFSLVVLTNDRSITSVLIGSLNSNHIRHNIEIIESGNYNPLFNQNLQIESPTI